MKRFKVQYFLRLFFFIVTLFLSCTTDSDSDPTIAVDEGIYINEIYSSGEDWIELYNNNSATKDISGYKIYDQGQSKYDLPEGTTIEGQGFLVINCDDTGSGLNANFKLSSDGETVFLENLSGQIVDKVEFGALADGESYGRYPDGSSTFFVSGTSTKGLSNGNAAASLIEHVSRNPLVPALQDDVTIEVELEDISEITSVKLVYIIDNGNNNEVEMTLNNGVYTSIIPALNKTGEVKYYIKVLNNEGKTTLDPYNAPEDFYSYLINTDELPHLRINEFLAYNSSCCPDNHEGEEEYDDWIEIFNGGTSSVDIGGMYLSDDPDNPFKSQISTGSSDLTTIEPGEFLILWADESTKQGVLHLNFKLSNDGESIGIYYKDGRPIDEYTFGGQSENISWGLATDGGDIWKSFTIPTPGKSNQ